MTVYLQTAARAGVEAPMTEAERAARIELAACYRIFDMLGWTELIFNHITVRVPGDEVRFLINPFGLHYREITASSLVLVDLEGNALRPTAWPVNRAGFVIHSALHGAIANAHCVMHTHTTTGVAVSCLKEGLSPHNFYAAMLHGQVAYHDLQGVTVDLREREGLVRNHALLAWGASVAQAFMTLWTLQRACDIQIAASQAGEVNPLSGDVLERMAGESGHGEKRTCDDVFAALMRMVDVRNPGYRD